MVRREKKTKFFYKKDLKCRWFLIDARNKILGRLATRIALILRGKNKPQYTPNTLVGDKVVVINAKHIKVTGKKWKDKIYEKYSGYPSGRKEINLETLMSKNPTKALYFAVKGMIPKNRLGRLMMRNLRIYAEENYPESIKGLEKIEV